MSKRDVAYSLLKEARETTESLDVMADSIDDMYTKSFKQCAVCGKDKFITTTYQAYAGGQGMTPVYMCRECGDKTERESKAAREKLTKVMEG